jgi:two-component system, chemotaxis family, chemotaxis protein CheY
VPVNVLVVDDSAVLRSMVIRTLRISGLPLGEVHQAGDGAVGLELLDANWIDLALIDINMPVMSGQEMIERIRANPESAGLPIIVVSTDCTEARRQALDVHGVAYVQKPFTPEQLRDAALNAMGLDHADICGNGTAPGGDFDF